ncbi:MAG TPA: flagellar protein FlgN [Deltaproteobacteria bacterium]|nr:flagellar protein FlgN [Deltaproteobacteria bacterium]
MTSIQACVGRLQTVLQAEEDLYLRMASLLRREESELIELDPCALEQTLEEKRAFAEEARLLEESRILVTAELGSELGLGEGPFKLSELIRQLGEEAGDLPSLHGRLTGLIGSTQALLQSNESFANRSLTRVRDTLRLLGQAVPEDVGYGPIKARSRGAGRGRLVRQAI